VPLLSSWWTPWFYQQTPLISLSCPLSTFQWLSPKDLLSFPVAFQNLCDLLSFDGHPWRRNLSRLPSFLFSLRSWLAQTKDHGLFYLPHWGCLVLIARTQRLRVDGLHFSFPCFLSFLISPSRLDKFPHSPTLLIFPADGVSAGTRISKLFLTFPFFFTLPCMVVGGLLDLLFAPRLSPGRSFLWKTFWSFYSFHLLLPVDSIPFLLYVCLKQPIASCQDPHLFSKTTLRATQCFSTQTPLSRKLGKRPCPVLICLIFSCLLKCPPPFHLSLSFLQWGIDNGEPSLNPTFRLKPPPSFFFSCSDPTCSSLPASAPKR